jgi:uncharacterized protein YvpB
MALAFRFPDKPVSEVELAKRCRCVKGLGSRVTDVYRAARRYKLKAEWLENTHIEMDVKAALDAGCPVMAAVQLRVLPYYLPAHPPQAWHAVLIVGLDDQSVCLHDPIPYGGPRRKVERADFFSDWTSHYYSAYRL